MNKDDIDELKQKVYDSDVIYQWEYIGHFAGKRIGPWAQWGLALFAPMIFTSIMEFGAEIQFGETGFFVTYGLDLIFIISIRYLFFPDEHYQYSLTQYGIYYTSEDVIPEAAYAAVRGFAWFGIAVCIVAIFVIGPMAFVGVGAMALLSFGLTNFSSKTHHLVLPFTERMVFFDYINDEFFETATYDSRDLIFREKIMSPSVKAKHDLIEKLTDLRPNIEISRIKKFKDKLKHPVYNQNRE